MALDFNQMFQEQVPQEEIFPKEEDINLDFSNKLDEEMVVGDEVEEDEEEDSKVIANYPASLAIQSLDLEEDKDGSAGLNIMKMLKSKFNKAK